MTGAPRPLAIAIAVLLALGINTADAAVHTVRPGESIQAAIDAAAPSDQIAVRRAPITRT
jgi:hypothetical protein